MSGNRHLAKNAVLNFIGLGAPMLVAIIAIPLLVRGLGVERFGILTLAWMVIGYFNLFDLGLGRALTKLVAEKLGSGAVHEIPGLIWTALALMTLLGIVGAGMLAWIAPWLVYDVLKITTQRQYETLKVFYILAATIPIVITNAGLRGVLEAYQRFDYTNAVRIPMGVFNFLAPLAVLPFSHNLTPVVAVLAAVRILGWAALCLLCFRVVPDLRSSIQVQRQFFLPLFRFGGWMTVSNVISPLMVYLDRFFIGALLSVTAVAYYTTPWELVTKLLIIPSALSSVLFPAFSASFVQDSQRSTLLFKRGMIYIFIIMFPIILTVLVFAQNILGLWLDTQFAEKSFRVMQLLAIGVMINGIAAIPFAFIQGMGRPDLTAKLHLLEVLIYLPAVYFLINKYGIVGASIAWLLRASIDALLLFIVAQRQISQQLVKFVQIVPTVFLTLTALMTAMIAFKLPTKIMFFGFAIAVFLFFAWIKLLDNEMRSSINNKIETLLIKWI
jgi:O-antigen/teichoic acid export membrane protein